MMHFSPTLPNFHKRRAAFQQISDFHLVISIKHIHFYLAFGTFALRGNTVFSENERETAAHKI
jgi:hypothetical protein